MTMQERMFAVAIRDGQDLFLWIHIKRQEFCTARKRLQYKVKMHFLTPDFVREGGIGRAAPGSFSLSCFKGAPPIQGARL
jgi:hypothetical protein